MKSDKLVTKALSGKDYLDVSIGGKIYRINPPTIKTMANACVYLSDIGEAQSLNDLLRYIAGIDVCASALSVFICGNDSLKDELCDAPFDDVIAGLSVALEMIDAENFLRLLASMRNVQMLIARPK